MTHGAHRGYEVISELIDLRRSRKDLPGKLDLTFPRLHKVIFVHGCF